MYPVAIKQDGTSVSWIVTASDTATVGAGRAELRWYVGDTLAKSAKFRTSVSSAMADSTTETPPEPQKSWVDKVLAAAQEIKDGAISDEQLAAAIAAYLKDHPIDAGLDEAALAAYLTENGYLTDAALADAITEALAEAKASGQFDGAPGKDGVDGKDGTQGVDGYTPVKGVDYGTPEEIDEIAQSAAEILQPEVSQIKDDLANKLPKSPTNWEAWTSEEQAAARERMGIGDYELIEEITIDTDDITVIVRDFDLNGNPYYFAKLWVICECPKQSQNVNITFGNGTHVSPSLEIANSSGDCSTNVEIDCTSGYLVYRYVNKVMYNWVAQPVYQTRPVLQMPASTRLVIQGSSIGNIPNGTKFKIYGVRK